MTGRKAIHLKFGLSWLTAFVTLSLATLILWDQLDLIGTTLIAWCEDVIELKRTSVMARAQFPFRCWDAGNTKDFFLFFMAVWIIVLSPFWLADYLRRTRIPTDWMNEKDA